MAPQDASNAKEHHTTVHHSEHNYVEPTSPLHHATTSQMHIGAPHTPSDTNQHKISHHQQEMDHMHAAAVKAAPPKPMMKDESKLHHA